MKTVYILIFLFVLSSTLLFGQQMAPQDLQKVAPTDTITPGKGKPEMQLKEIKKEKVKHLSDSYGNEPKKSSLVDTTVQNKYGDLLNDDTMYNKKYPLWKPLVQVVAANVFVWSLDRYIANADFSRIGSATWKYNLKNGWEWDTDRF
jgi:hypothetical protein